MKTKEITCYVSKDFLTDGVRSESVYQNKPCGNFNLKARVIVEIPEKKIEITESEFNEAMKRVIDNYPNNYTASKTALVEIKTELGFCD